LLQLPSILLIVRLPPMLTVHHSPSPSPSLSAHLSPLRATPFAPSLSVCHEMHVKTYLVRFARGGKGEGRTRANGTGVQTERDGCSRTSYSRSLFPTAAAATSSSSRHFPLYSAVHGFSLPQEPPRHRGGREGRRTSRQSRAWAISLFHPRVYIRGRGSWLRDPSGD